MLQTYQAVLMYKGARSPLLSVQLKRVTDRGDLTSPNLFILFLLPLNLIKVIIRKEMKVETNYLKCDAVADDLMSSFQTKVQINI